MEEYQLWLKSVESVRKDINAIVCCPSCKTGVLVVIDIAFDNNDVNKGGERYIVCPNCEKFKIVLYRKPPKNWNPKN